MRENESNENGGESAEFARFAAAMQRYQETYNETADPEMGGLTPRAVHALLSAEWGEPGEVLQFRTDLALSALEGAPIFRRVRRLLSVLHERGGIKTTATGNLPRAFVAEMLADPEMGEAELRRKIASTKVANEEDFHLLHVVKVVARVAGLLHLSRGRLAVTAKAAKLLEERRAGELFARFFIAYFRKFNLAYLHPYELEAPALQHCVAFTFYRLPPVARDWITVDAVYPQVFLPAVRAALEAELAGRRWLTPPVVAARRILDPLLEFGLLEGRFEERNYYPMLTAIRCTPLFGQFLEFRLGT